MCKDLVNIFGEGTVFDRTCRRRFEKFESGDFDLNYKPRSGKPSLIDDCEEYYTARLFFDKRLRKSSTRWCINVPNELTGKNLHDHIYIGTNNGLF